MSKDVEELMQHVQDTYLTVNQHFKIIIESDPAVLRPDSAKGILQLIADIQTIIAEVNALPLDRRTQLFNVTYNAVVYATDIASFLRKSNYAFQVVKDILDCILAMQSNIILQDVKYLDLRTKLYVDVCHIYEENEYLQPALALLNAALTKYKQLREIHEMDPPVPKHVDTILVNNLRTLKIMHLKYSIQSGAVNANDWKKKADEQFGDNPILKLASLVQCLRTETRKNSNVFQKSPHTSINSKTFKQTLLQIGFDTIKPHMQTIVKALNQQKTKIEREVQFKNTMNLTQQLINSEIKKKRETEQKYLKESELKRASESFPFEYHAELIHYAFEVKNSKILASLLEAALLRIQCRRVEVPFVNDVGIIASSTRYPNIPNGYEKIPVDLNEANLKIELKKLRKRDEGSKPVVQPVVQPPKDAKKGGKAPPPEEPKQKANKDEPTEQELEKINHKYVFMIMKKSMSPENAVFDLNIVMGDEQAGPAGFVDTRRIIVPYIQQEMDVKASHVKQYKGIKQSTNMVPYIVLKHSKSALENQSELQTILVDVQPLVGKSPITPPLWGYHKIPIDLRQVPEQFVKNTNHDYVYITYKTDQLFHVYSRYARVIHALNELENTYSPSSANSKVENPHDQKLLELSITYDLEKLNNFFLALEECLEGKLGHEFFEKKINFLTQLVFYVWTKYLRNPLAQFDYVNEMRLNEQIVDYDYQYYQQALLKCKPIFLNGFKILTFIMMNNGHSDVLLLSRLCLQLMKLQEEEQEYQTASENGRRCLDRLRIFRDNYLNRGVKGNRDRLLPFSLTCSTSKVKDTVSRMQNKFKQQRNEINKLRRIRQRKASQQQPLSQEQLQEEQEEYLHYQKKDEIDQVIQKVETSHSQLAAIVSAVELDILNIFFRVTLKHADYLKLKEKLSANSVINGINQNQTLGLATSTKRKLDLLYTKNEQKNQKNLKQLQTTLIQADKLPPPKPGLHWLEKKTIEEFQKNPYAFCMLMINFAAANSQSEDKKYFLKEALEKIKECVKMEEELCEASISNAIFIMSTLWEDEIDPNINSSSISPFTELYDGTWPCHSQVPDQPILISKNSSSISMKFAPFSPAGKKNKNIKFMSLFGKPSANGVDVSVNCNQLEGTGCKNGLDQIVRVTHLKPNDVYCFAAAPTNSEEQLEPIGKTSKDIPTCHPLPIPMMAGYLAKVSYQINEFAVAEKAARIVTNAFCELSGYQSPDEKLNSLYMYKFKEEALNQVSLLEIRALAESLYIMALCERKALLQMKEDSEIKPISPILLDQKERCFTNWLMLASLLNPILSAPIYSIPFLIPDEFVSLKALSLSLIGQKWMNHKLQELGVKVMSKAMEWGLQKNQIGLVRRMMYKWSERKWMMLGKIIQVQQKKDVKKGAKEPKDQEQKMIDKYCRMLLEKAPGNFDLFEDSLGSLSEEYSDFLGMFVERAKEQINYFAQFVENSSEELDAMTNSLNSKLELVEYLRDPINSIKKVPENSPQYLEHNCKIFRKALQCAAPNDLKTLQTKSDELVEPQLPAEVQTAASIKSLILQAIAADIAWTPNAKNDVIMLQEKTGCDLSVCIKLYSDYEEKMAQLTNSIAKMDSFLNKTTDFDYINLWLSELSYLKAEIRLINCSPLKVKNPVKGRYDKARFMNLEDILKKKQETQILEKQSISYTEAERAELELIMKHLCDAAFRSYCIDNWTKLQNIFKLVYNLFNEKLITPFYHRGSGLYRYFAFLSLMGIQMLQKIRRQGYDSFRNRYELKKSRTQLKSIAEKLQQPVQTIEVVEVFQPRYYTPQLDSNTTKNFWFKKEPRIDIQAIASVIAYSVQNLRIQSKFNLVINLAREFCNVTQHYYSLEFLPFMIESQQKLIEEVQDSINKENTELNEIVTEFTRKKNSKMKGERQHKLSNQPLPYEVEYQEKRRKVLGSIELLTNHKNYLAAQIDSSRAIIDEIKRDTSKTVLKQREQRKYMLEFGDDEQHMFKNYQDGTGLARNRKNALINIIGQYNQIYDQLRGNKTSKDTLAEIQNRNEVGNLHFAAGSNKDACVGWEDALATIFKKVGPVDNYLEILSERKSFLVNSVGEREAVLSMNLLYKISKFGCFNRLESQYNCLELACSIGASLFQNHGTHPQTLLGHASYRLTKLSHNDIFEDQATISLSQLLSSLDYFSLKAIDSNKSINALPLINLYEHLAVDITKKVELAVRAKIIKAIALAHCGLISEAIVYIAKVSQEKDLPITWIDPSDHLKREKGQNWFFEEVTFDNSKHWSEPPNKEAIEYLKKITLRPDFAASYGLSNPILLHYARALTLAVIFDQQDPENYESNELRVNNVQEAEGIMRDCLKKLAILEEHYCNLQEVETKKLKLKRNEMSEEVQKQLATSKASMVSYLKSQGIDEPTIAIYSSETPSVFKRVDRLEFMARLRFSIYKTHLSRRLYSNCFYVLKKGLLNMHRYSYGSRKVQTGNDPQIAPVAPPQQTGKKDDKKGGKKQQEKVQAPSEEFNEQKQKQLQLMTQKSGRRTAMNVFWHIKMSFQLGKLMYQQNNFQTSCAVFESLIKQCQAYEQCYFSCFAKGYILRNQLRLGHFKLNGFEQLLRQVEGKQLITRDYLDLVMDLGEILKGERCLSLYEKGREAASKMWLSMGMKSILAGIGVEPVKRLAIKTDELNAEQEEEIKRKAKKAEKKGGKDQKKAAKKQDPKKKKDQTKAEYKVEPLVKNEEWNIQEEDKRSFDHYVQQPHPNFHQNNIYTSIPLIYIKSYLRWLEATIQTTLATPESSNEDLIQNEQSYLTKLVTIVDTYRSSGYYYHLHAYFCLAEINRRTFLSRLHSQIISQPQPQKLKLKLPLDDLPLNSQLIKVPAYSHFVFSNRHLLLEAQKNFKKVIGLLKSNCLFIDNDFRLDRVAFYAADNQLRLAEYRGRFTPKYYPLEVAADEEQENQLNYLNQIGEASNMLNISVRIMKSINEMTRNYSELGSKPLQPAAKIDQDIINDINSIDKESKSHYPKMIVDSLKPKQGITSLELITYLTKISREAEFMTFSNSHLQNVMLRTHRGLLSGLPTYKEKCILNEVEYTNKKTAEETFVKDGQFLMKSLPNGDREEFLYILGKTGEGKIYYGRLNIQKKQLSRFCEKLYWIQSKMAISEKKSEAVKQRDFGIYRKDLNEVLVELGKKFTPSFYLVPQNTPVDLSRQNIQSLLEMLENCGVVRSNPQITGFLRHLHECKYGASE